MFFWFTASGMNRIQGCMSENEHGRFTSPAVLRKVSVQRLRAFLCRFEPFFKNRKIELPPAPKAAPSEQTAAEQEDDYDYSALAHAIARPDGDSPPKMVDALHLINEMCSESAHDAMLDKIEERKLKIDLPANITTAEIALALWMTDSKVLYDLSIEERYTLQKKFAFFRADVNPPFLTPTQAQMTEMCAEFDVILLKTSRGKGSRLFVYNEADEEMVRILVQHGQPCKREGNYINDKPESLLRRPDVFDALHYSKKTGELSVNCDSKKVLKKYLEVLGSYIFKRADAFKPAKKYQLEPLWKKGEGCLSTGGILGDPLDRVVLREVTIAWNRQKKDFETRKALDLFAAMKERGLTFKAPQNGTGEIIRAKFDVFFKKDKAKPRRLMIATPNDAQYERDEDGKVLEAWMREQKFTIQPVSAPSKKGAPDGTAFVEVAGEGASGSGRGVATKAGN